MQIDVVKATLNQQPILANLLELYAYDFTEFCDFDIGDNGFCGYEYLPLYWADPLRFPYLIYVNKKIAGFVLVQKGSPISNSPMAYDISEVYDISEFFIMKKYKRCGVGTAAVHKIWSQFKGLWQVRVLVCNHKARSFWMQAIEKFTAAEPAKTKAIIKGEEWLVLTFESKDEISI